MTDESVVASLAEAILGFRTQRDLKARTAEAIRAMADGWSLAEGFVELMLSRAEELNGQQRYPSSVYTLRSASVE